MSLVKKYHLIHYSTSKWLAEKKREKQFVYNKEFVLIYVAAVKSPKAATKAPQDSAVIGRKVGRNKVQGQMKNSGGRVFLWHPFLNIKQGEAVRLAQVALRSLHYVLHARHVMKLV